MLRYVQRRALTSIVSILGISVIAFLLPRLAPGDPALVLMSDDATDEIIQETREFWGLNKPLYEQYYIFIVRAARFDLGTSLVTGRSTIETVKDFFPNTIKLALVAWVWSVLVSIPLGVLAALHRNKIPDIVIRLFAMLGGNAQLLVGDHAHSAIRCRLEDSPGLRDWRGVFRPGEALDPPRLRPGLGVYGIARTDGPLGDAGGIERRLRKDRPREGSY